MKPTHILSGVLLIISIFSMAMAPGKNLQAQTKQADPDTCEMKSITERLGLLMYRIEQSIRYSAPGEMNDDVRESWSRLELLADKTENEIRYACPMVEYEEQMALKENSTSEAKELVTMQPISLNYLTLSLRQQNNW